MWYTCLRPLCPPSKVVKCVRWLQQLWVGRFGRYDIIQRHFVVMLSTRHGGQDTSEEVRESGIDSSCCGDLMYTPCWWYYIRLQIPSLLPGFACSKESRKGEKINEWSECWFQLIFRHETKK